MDLLERLQLDDVPEQQTRTIHLMNAVDGGDDSTSEPPPTSLGFDNCANCGKELASLSSSPVVCKNCQRIKYCSIECQHADANVQLNTSLSEEEGGGDGALGHTAIICSLLKLCHDDELVESNKNHGGQKGSSNECAARDRVRSEYESYASTLANVLVEGPCFQPIFQQALHQQSLTIHIIGASADAELTRGPTVTDYDDSCTKVIQDYAEACAELAERNELNAINLYFIGPDCPESPWEATMPMQMLDKIVGKLSAMTYKGIYHDVLSTQDIPNADIVVFFHPGFTVPDYDQWAETLAAIPSDTPFLITSNTEMEAIADTQYLLEQNCIQSIPAGLADILQVDIDNDNCFFAVNPFHGMRVRQNQTMANDVYVKNRWMLGGTFGNLRPPKKPEERPTTKRKVNAGLI